MSNFAQCCWYCIAAISTFRQSLVVVNCMKRFWVRFVCTLLFCMHQTNIFVCCCNLVTVISSIKAMVLLVYEPQ